MTWETPPQCNPACRPRGRTEDNGLYTGLRIYCSSRSIATVALPRISCVRLPASAMEPKISNSLPRTAVTRCGRGSQRTSGFGRLYSASGVSEPMSLTVVLTCTRGGVALSMRRWDLREPRV